MGCRKKKKKNFLRERERERFESSYGLIHIWEIIITKEW